MFINRFWLLLVMPQTDNFTEKEITSVAGEIQLYKQYVHLFKIKKKYILLHGKKNLDFLVKHLNYLIPNQKKLLEREFVDFKVISQNYQNIVAHESTFADSILDVNIKTNLAKFKSGLHRLHRILNRLLLILSQQYNLVNHNLVANFKIFRNRVDDEEKILKRELYFLSEEKKQAEKIEKKEDIAADPKHIQENLKNIFKKSTYIVGSSVYPIVSTAGYKLAKYKGFDRETARDFLNHFIFEPRNHPYQCSVQIKPYDANYSYLIFIFKGGSDATGRSKQATAIFVLFHRKNHPYLLHAAKEHSLIFMVTLVNSCLGHKAKYLLEITGSVKPVVLD